MIIIKLLLGRYAQPTSLKHPSFTCLKGSLPNFNEIEKVSKYEMGFER